MKQPEIRFLILSILSVLLNWSRGRIFLSGLSIQCPHLLPVDIIARVDMMLLRGSGVY